MTYLPLPETSVNFGKTAGIDYASHQGLVDLDKMHNPPAGHPVPEFFAIRSGISWGYVDKYFLMNFAAHKEYGDPLAVYHVFRPDADVNRQMDAWFKLLDMAKFDGTEPLVPDIELDLGMGKSAVTNMLLGVWDRMDREGLKNRITYSRATFIDYYCIKGLARYNTELWWLAQVLSQPSRAEYPGWVDLPAGVDRDQCLIHQTSWKMDGRAYGCESGDMDFNRWQGDRASMLAFFGKQDTPQNPPVDPLPVDPTLIAALGRWQADLDSLSEEMRLAREAMERGEP